MLLRIYIAATLRDVIAPLYVRIYAPDIGSDIRRKTRIFSGKMLLRPEKMLSNRRIYPLGLARVKLLQ